MSLMLFCGSSDVLFNPNTGNANTKRTFKAHENLVTRSSHMECHQSQKATKATRCTRCTDHGKQLPPQSFFSFQPADHIEMQSSTMSLEEKIPSNSPEFQEIMELHRSGRSAATQPKMWCESPEGGNVSSKHTLKALQNAWGNAKKKVASQQGMAASTVSVAALGAFRLLPVALVFNIVLSFTHRASHSSTCSSACFS